MLMAKVMKWTENHTTIPLLSLGVEDRIPQIFHYVCNLHCESESDAASSAVSYCWEIIFIDPLESERHRRKLKRVWDRCSELPLSSHVCFTTSHAVMFAPFLFVLGDREASRCWKWDHDEGSRPGEKAVTQRQGIVSHKGRPPSIALNHLNHFHSWAWHANSS